MNYDPAPAEAFLQTLHERERRQDDPEALEQFGDAYQTLATFARQADRSEQDQILQTLADGMKEAISNWEFGCIANTCGMIVEWGGDPAIAIAPILDRITIQFARVHEFVTVMQEKLGVEHPNKVAEPEWQVIGEAHPDHAWVIGEWIALRFTGCAAMTMLVRDVEARKQARERIDLVRHAESVRSDNPFAYFLAELLGMVDDESLLVLDTTRRLGFRVRLTAIRNNFHFFTLLQDALLAHPTAANWQGPRVQPLIVALAKSELMLPDISPNELDFNEGDAAIWSYSTALAEIRGEMKPVEIPTLDGERVVVLALLELPRRWDIGFFSPLHRDLRSAVVVDAVLSEEEYDTRMTKIRNPMPLS